jgi:hypothetical protein
MKCREPSTFFVTVCMKKSFVQIGGRIGESESRSNAPKNAYESAAMASVGDDDTSAV